MRYARLLRLLATLVLAFGLVLHLTVADRSGVLRAVFYALPWPVLAVGWLVMSLFWNWRHTAGALCLVLGLGCGAWWFALSCRLPPASPQSRSTPTLKVLSWNMAHERLPSPDLRKFLETFKPDVAGLVEVGSRHSDPGPLVKALPAGYTAQKLDYAMAVVVRGTVRVLHEVEMGNVSKFASLELTIDGAIWKLFIVDGTSHPLVTREDVLTRILAEAQPHPRTFIVGDFNTPIESALFDPWRASFQHAFNNSGRGFRETWPRQLPVLTIDHVWTSRDLNLLRTEKRWLKSSDHAALLVELKR
jgi:endonuclease/exonuclease/phosphatase family metal-dependent hydrolase